MIKYILTIATISILAGCGGGSADNANQKELGKKNIIKSDKSYHLAKDTLVHNVTKSFGNHTLKVLTDKALDEDATSNGFISLYGLVDGKDTKALLVLNANYPKGTKVVVEAYSGDDLVAKSKPVIINTDEVNFGSIQTK